jgi:outer membrane lipoprotein-sorting protein
MFRKSLGALALGLLAMAALAPQAAQAQTADELIEKNLQAKGGREKLKAVQTLRMTGKMNVGPGAEAPFTLELKRPNRGRIEFTLQGMTGIQGYDGTTGWMVMPFLGKKDPETMAAEDLKTMENQFDFEGPLVDYKAKGHQVELVGKEEVEGAPVYRLKVTKKNGDISNLFLDGEYFLEIRDESKVTQRGQEVEIISTFGDYKPVDGLVFAHSLSVQPKGIPAPPQVLTIEKIEVNPDLADDRFTMPKPAAAPAAPKAEPVPPAQP